MIKVYLMTAIMDLSFPGQQTATATSCIPHDSVYMPGPRAGKSDTWLQIFQNDSKICEAEVTVTPLINKICKPWLKHVFVFHCFRVLKQPMWRDLMEALCKEASMHVSTWQNDALLSNYLEIKKVTIVCPKKYCLEIPLMQKLEN